MAAESLLPSTLPFHWPLWRNGNLPECKICKLSTQLQAAKVMFFQVMGWETNSPQLSIFVCISDTRARKDRLVFSCKWNFSACIALGGSKMNSKGVSCYSHRSDWPDLSQNTLPVELWLSSCSTYQLRPKQVMSVAQWFGNAAQWMKHRSVWTHGIGFWCWSQTLYRGLHPHLITDSHLIPWNPKKAAMPGCTRKEQEGCQFTCRYLPSPGFSSTQLPSL